MPTVAELERLQALVGRLEPLAHKRRGELIAADDWNALVQALLEVTRVALASDRGEAVAPHAHPDEVGLGWLDARLRQLITAGGLADPAAEAELGKLRRDLGRLGTRIDGVDEGVKDVRFRVADVSTKDLAREADLIRVARRVDGLGDARVEVADVRRTLAALEVEVGRAVEVGRRLEVDGPPVDMADVLRRLGGADELRQRLTAASGELLDAAAFERRVAQLETSLVTEAELDDALRPLRDATTAVDRAELLEEARRAALEAVDSRVAVLDADLRALVTQRLGEVEPAVEAAVGRASGALTEQILAATRQEAAAALAAAGDALRTDLTAQLDQRLSLVTDSVEARLTAALDAVDVRVDAELDARLPALTEGLEARLVAAEEGQAVLRTTTDSLAADAKATADRVETGLRREAAARAQVRAELTTRVDALDAGITPRLEAAVAALREGLRTDLQAELAAGRRDLEAVLSATAREAAATDVRLLGTRLESEVRVALRQELDGVRLELLKVVDERLATGETRVAGLVNEEVRRATADLSTVVQKQFDAFRPTIERIVDERMGRDSPVRPMQPPPVAPPEPAPPSPPRRRRGRRPEEG